MDQIDDFSIFFFDIAMDGNYVGLFRTEDEGGFNETNEMLEEIQEEAFYS